MNRAYGAVKADRRASVFAVLIAVIAILTLIFLTRNRSLPASETEVLRRAQVLCERLMPTEAPPLEITRNTVTSVPTALAKFIGTATACDEWNVTSIEEQGMGRFLVGFDVQTGEMRRLVWSRSYSSRHSGDETGHRDCLTRARALTAARDYLRLLGVPSASNSFLVKDVSWSDQDRAWCIRLRSPRYVASESISAATADLR